ncbi:probable glycosyltransferase At5g03795 [Sesamum indicum]|uniref:Probable glycosyltransferase At5g03795 n=1 Tax=Sesamum indicum TaxID=4182 RepID=A0A6I9TKA3_SESIN|nr:probable glycosyltransferase At5g03795 [Sesamum indicum]XP_011081310.1 probable glycosyltransferase At5g03795 [Sesamum indicum]XP_020549952.1 probable glycosyltransferase At5g03795 [Sesamum indicum]XP_020549953.1 probable glycosyltransferase At5g03795 [Sesamum indicum]
MTKLLRTILIFLIFKIDWRKLFLVSSILTIGSVLILISSLPYPLTEWISQPHPAISSYLPLNTAVHLGKSHLLAAGVHLETIRDTPIMVSKGEQKTSRRRKGSSRVKSINMVSPPAPQHIVKKLPNHIQKHLSSLTPDKALAFAKRDIENASVTSDDDPELYAPLFRNISTFKRSYEWMEWMLKVYIYEEGRKPIFHTPHRTGIYASEGWFLMLMEENRQFVTKDPEKAHLFYLPYSARQLQMELYVPNSHNLKPLAIFLRDYVNMLAAKYPFWNRTHGSDHFLVACHDWGPYILKEHEELQKNTIKALCNADVSEKIFMAGKDISLPETTIRQPRRPQRNVGGNRVSQRPILAFFAGHRHGRVRPTLLKYWSDKDDDMRIYGPLPNRASRVMSYPQHMKSSKYCICPMGFEVNSPRIVEAIYYECVPVIIADNFVPPLSEVLNWDAFSVTVAEKDIPKLKEILLTIPLRKYLIMQTNVKRVQKHFLWNLQPVPYDLFHMILHSIWLSRLNQIQVAQSS